MKIQYLGTAAAEGWPGLFCACDMCQTARKRGGRNIRTRSQAAIFAHEVDQGTPDERLLIDFPADTYMHCLNHGLRLQEIGHLIITHSHDDHFAPNDLAYRNNVFAVPNPPFPLHIYGNDKTEQAFMSGLKPHERQNMEFHIVETGQQFMAGAYKITALPALHDRSERCLFYLIEHEGKAFLYGNDTGIFPPQAWEILSGHPIDVISLDCITGKHKDGTNHMGLPDIIELKEMLASADCLKPDSRIILHHFSHNGGACHDEMVELARPHGFDVAYDGGVWTV